MRSLKTIIIKEVYNKLQNSNNFNNNIKNLENKEIKKKRKRDMRMHVSENKGTEE